MKFCHLQELHQTIMDHATKTELHALKTASKNVVHKAAEATGKFMGN